MIYQLDKLGESGKIFHDPRKLGNLARPLCSTTLYHWTIWVVQDSSVSHSLG